MSFMLCEFYLNKKYKLKNKFYQYLKTVKYSSDYFGEPYQDVYILLVKI